MKLPPALVVHGLLQARTALAPALPVTLLSAPGAGLYAGAGWWLALIQAASEGGEPPVHILDCGAAAGRALEAARAGQPLVVLRAPDDIFQEASAIAASYGTILLPSAPRSLDLATFSGERDMLAWLQTTEHAAPTTATEGGLEAQPPAGPGPSPGSSPPHDSRPRMR
jgi:hypothetical protein